MCILVNTYQTCALFGHPIQEANATGFKTVLCNEAKAKSDTFGMCQDASAQNIPDFAYPHCNECDEVDDECYKKVKEILEANESAGSPETKILTEDFVAHLRGLPIDRERAPVVSPQDILDFIRVGILNPVADIDRTRASAWIVIEKRKANSRINTDGARDLFARWLIAACKLRHIAAAMAIAMNDGDSNRLRLLHLIANQVKVVSIWRARLDRMGMFSDYVFYAGISESPLFNTPILSDLDSLEGSEVIFDISSTESDVDEQCGDVGSPLSEGWDEVQSSHC
ncbi:hypothetical protein BKA67DRAFT_681326 [Truncatella angustata]|uniref:Uncharacterized protein n=1 Tax=Truncatella angustata TaxID=152316 RepID=A0A9P8ZSE8_9PEZI|nr:uncharacterized protein BKA67DRAFT_681326 [Truncatella angustata]KAH6648320.1 hypothetical protein BKA67DRAFT_681326 [Truncatella angustata]